MWDIETALKAEADSFNLYNSAFNVRIPKRANDTILFGNVGTEFRMKPVCMSVDGILTESNKVVYPNAFGLDIDMEVWVNKKGVKKEIVIKKTNSKKLTFDFELSNSGLPAIKESLSKTHIFAKNVDVITVLRRTAAWDADNRSIDVSSSIIKDGMRMLLRKIITIPEKATSDLMG